MQPRVTFQPFRNKNYPSHQHFSSDVNFIQQQAPTSPLTNNSSQITRNNYHYNYSPGNNNIDIKTNNNDTSQQNFNRPQSHHEINQRPNSLFAKQQPQTFAYTINSRPINETQPQLQLKEKFSSNLFKNTFKLLDLSKFVEKNVKLRKKLLAQLQSIKEKKLNLNKQAILTRQQEKGKAQTRDTTPKRHSREKSSNLHERKPHHPLTQTKNQQQQEEMAYLSRLKLERQRQIQQQKQALKTLQSCNQQKQAHLQSIQSKTLRQSIHETPLLKQKQQAIQYLSIEIEWLNEKSAQLKKIVSCINKNQPVNMFEMYEQMCREVEALRKQNNKKSEKLKKLFQKTNKLTAKQQNVNMFLMNLKV